MTRSPSCRRLDGKHAAHWLRREIESFRSPKSLRDRWPTGLRAYRDTAYERHRGILEDRIRQALLGARALVVVATSDAARQRSDETDWVSREIAEFTSGQNGRNVAVVRAGGAIDDPPTGNLQQIFPNIEIIDLRDAGRFWFLNPLKTGRIGAERLKRLALAAEDMPKLPGGS